MPARHATRLGIFGGTFDPPHIGHLATAVEVRSALDLDEVWMVVANEPWQKSPQRAVTSARDRLALVVAAVDGLDGVVASGIEIDRGGPSYTIDTLEELDREHPEAEVVVVLGADAAAGLPTWHRADELRERATFAVVERPGIVAPAPPEGWRCAVVAVPRLDVSSSDLRARVGAGRPIDVLVPPAAIAGIQERRLYGWRRR
jgi:nicotinate-nucleotide adenylyltransferase